MKSSALSQESCRPGSGYTDSNAIRRSHDARSELSAILTPQDRISSMGILRALSIKHLQASPVLAWCQLSEAVAEIEQAHVAVMVRVAESVTAEDAD